jgi:hypothetical protein
MHRQSRTVVLIVPPSVAACQARVDKQTIRVNILADTIDPRSREPLIRDGIAQIGALTCIIVGTQGHDRGAAWDRSSGSCTTALRAGDAGSRPTHFRMAGPRARRRVGATLSIRLSRRRLIPCCNGSNIWRRVTTQSLKGQLFGHNLRSAVGLTPSAASLEPMK